MVCGGFNGPGQISPKIDLNVRIRVEVKENFDVMSARALDGIGDYQPVRKQFEVATMKHRTPQSLISIVGGLDKGLAICSDSHRIGPASHTKGIPYFT